MINIMTWMRGSGISEDQTQAQADRLRLKSIPSRTAPIRPSYTFGVSGIKGASARRSSGSESEEEESVMEPEPRAAVVKREWAPTPMDEEVQAKIMQLPTQEQRRSFLKILTQAPSCGPSTATQATADTVFSFVGKKLPSCRRCWSASAPTARPETSDSDGTSEVSLESEPVDQSVAGATFLG